MNSSFSRHIVRFEYSGAKAWFFRIEQKRFTYRRLFSDSRYGSSMKSLEAALLDKKRIFRESPELAFALPYRLRLQSNNRTGVNGISLTYGRSGRRSKAIMPCVSVSYRDSDGRNSNKKFYYSTYGGEEGAFAAAVDFRRKKESEMLGNSRASSRGRGLA